ncbi:uncharacterized protein LOC127724909 [Mytilus californianus]|uniref:uncharacterized protein LOC127724909 n=1 Tax=Mytilus californianus TaxID=6549 RepID=UPI002247A0A7|nr:uncharacterized protein LOC127724909 [Mytilus californianus]
MQKETEAHQIDVTNILKYNGATLSVPSLTIFNVTIEDDGIYFCEAGNSYEIRTSQEVALTVTSDPTSTTPTRTQNPGTTSPSATSITTQNPGITSPSTTSTTTQNPGTKSPSTTSTTTQNPRTTSTSTTTSTTTQNSGTTSPSTTSTTNQNPGTTSTSTTTSTKTQNPGKPFVSTTLTTPTTTTKPEAISCQCPCSSLGIWARRDLSNYTIDELLEMLAPQLAKTEKELSVDKSNLSATINKRISAKDERKSSQSIGILGIVFIFSVIFGVVIIDLMSIMRFMKPKLKTGKTDTSEPEGRSE